MMTFKALVVQFNGHVWFCTQVQPKNHHHIILPLTREQVSSPEHHYLAYQVGGVCRDIHLGQPLTSGGSLIDSSYKCKSDLILERREYEVALARHYLLPQLLRFFGWLSFLDIARKEKEGTVTKDLENIDHIDLKKDAAGVLYRSSQEHWKVN